MCSFLLVFESTVFLGLTTRDVELFAASLNLRSKDVLASMTMFVMKSANASVMASCVRYVRSIVYVIVVAGSMD